VKILILGGTALTGPHVIRQLIDHEITTLSRSMRQVATERAVKGDRTIVSNVERALIAADPDLVIDMVPFTVEGANALVTAFGEWNKKVPVIALSSLDVYAGYGRLHGTEDTTHQETPIRESDTLRTALGPEGATYDKIGVETVYHEALDDLTILRAPVIYGWPDGTRIATYLDPMLDGKKTIVIPENVMPFRISRSLHKNVAYAITLASTHPLKGQSTYNIAEPSAYSEIEWATRIANLVGWRGELVAGPPVPNKTFTQDLTADSTAIRSDLGYEEKFDPKEGLRDAVAFWAHHRTGLPYEKGY